MGRRIDDHSFWAGKKSEASVFPEGVHTKEYRSSEGAGAMRGYPDTTEEIYKDQEEAARKVEREKPKEGYRY